MPTDPTETAKRLFSGEADEFSDSQNEYYAKIDELAEKLANREIKNSQPRHALYLILKLIEIANESIRIYTGSLSERSRDGLVPLFGHPEVVRALRDALDDRGVSVRIIVQEQAVRLDQHSLVLALGTRENFSVDHISGASLSELEKRSVHRNHFILVDDKSYRIETDHDSLRAFANFGDEDLGARLGRLFDGLIAAPQKAA